MKSNLKIPTAVSAILPCLGLLATSALGDAGQGGQQPGMADQQTGQKRSKTGQRAQMREVSGEIAKMKQVEVRGTDVKNTVVLLDTNKNNRRLIVDLGPTSALGEQKLKVGQKIQVQGVPVQLKEHRLLVASRFKAQDGKMVEIRRQQQVAQHQKAAKQQGGQAGESGQESGY